MASAGPEPALSQLYGQTQARVVALVTGLDGRQVEAPVPACPGWRVRDVVAHLTAVSEDVLEGRLTGPPSDEQTAAQVARFRDRPLSEVLTRWEELGPRFGEAIDGFDVWPAVLDVATHEHDIRGAVAEPGARDSEVVRLGAERLLTWMQPPVALRVVVEDETYDLGPGGGEPIQLTTGRFEVLRWRMGRRSRLQLAGLDWAGDPSPVLDHLVVFGPSPADITE
ncbi:MAG: maleylpyruvate isomerase family mycothiol-dependent enzyme [Acidimicrobiales bacterium]